ncbi:hypothetical protein M0812_02642 [Anaeramoeba flamelloides]|uniref:Uncharacterized protein n=1 Tax=Anaeramoeba flamelloides TaxID=1746091 RepID=A0AAV7YSX4_9EUKA|nr:hypothetical protein M0812_02642 [Anaeramoeba flamelloides]
MNNQKTISALYLNLIEIERKSEEKDISIKAKELIEELIHRGYYSILCQGIVHIRTVFDRNDLLSIGKTNYSIKNPELIEKLCYKEFVRIKETIKNRFDQINFQKLNNSLFVSFQRGLKKLVGLSLVYKSLLNRTDTQQKIKKKLVLISKKIHKYQIATQCYLWLQSSKIAFQSPKTFKIIFFNNQNNDKG